MAVFFTSLIYISVAGGLLIRILPCSSPFEKQIKFVVGIMTAFFIIVSVVPLLSSVGDVIENFRNFILASDDVNNNTDSGEKWIIKESTENIEKAVADAVSKKFRVSQECISVNVETDTSDKNNIIIERIVITLIGDGRYISAASVSEYVSDLLMCKCEVYYEGKE